MTAPAIERIEDIELLRPIDPMGDAVNASLGIAPEIYPPDPYRLDDPALVPKGWVIDVRGPIHYRYGVVDWEVEACDSSHTHCDRGSGPSMADAADQCREALGTAVGR